MNILEQIAQATRQRVEAAKAERPAETVKAEALALPRGDFAFEKALHGDDVAFICEVKKASPSKGVIAEDFPYLDIAKQYDAGGAAAISVLTEPQWFMGSDQYLQEIASAVSIPCLRKDFTVDEYQIYEAKLLGAQAVLLIVSLLTEQQLKDYLAICETLGLSALVEAHDGEEIATALAAGARVIGVNNRNLKDFTVDVENSGRLRDLVPADVVFVAESGIHTPKDVEAVRAFGANAVLVGESLMRADNIAHKIAELKGAH